MKISLGINSIFNRDKCYLYVWRQFNRNNPNGSTETKRVENK